MLQSAFKLACAAAAMLGPFAAGLAHQYVANSEAAAFFMIAGVFLGIGGLVGFATVEREERVEHRRNLHGEG